MPAIVNETLAIGTHVFMVNPRVQTNIVVDSLGSGGTASVDFTYDDRGEDTILSGGNFAADVASAEWAPGGTARSAQTLRGPVTAIRFVVAGGTVRVVADRAGKVRKILFPGGETHVGNKIACAMTMTIAASGRQLAPGVGAVSMNMVIASVGLNSVHHGAGSMPMTMAQAAGGTIDKTHHGDSSVSMNMTLASVGSNPVHHGDGVPAMTMALAGTSADLKVHHGTAAMPMTMALDADGSNPVHHGDGVPAMNMALAGVGLNPTQHGIGALAMGMALAATGTNEPAGVVSLASDFNEAVLLEDTTGPLVSGQADGRVCTISFWYKNNANHSHDQEIIRIQNGSSQAALNVRNSWARSQSLVVNTTSSGSNSLISCASANSSVQVADGWNHFMCSFENTFPLDSVAHVTGYFNGVLLVHGTNGEIVNQSIQNLDIAYNARGKEIVSASNGFPSASGFLDGQISNLYVNIQERLDLTIQANREKFYSATGGNTDLGSDGSAPTGSQPIIFAPDGDLRVNAGYGPNLTKISGTITAVAGP